MRDRMHWVVYGAALAALLGSCAKAPSVATEAPSRTGAAERSVLQTYSYDWFNRAYHTLSDCYQFGSQKVRFKIYDVGTDRALWDLLANTVIASCTDSIKLPPSGAYAFRMPALRKGVMILWKNVTTGKRGYVVVTKEPGGVFATTTGGSVWTLSYDKLEEFSWEQEPNHYIHIDVLVSGPRNRSFLTNERAILVYMKLITR